MNLYQKVLLTLFIPVSLIIIALDYIFPSQYFVDIIKFATMAALLLASLYIKKKYNEQLLLLLALFFAVTGDFFLVLLEHFLSFSWPMAIFFFTLAYISLSVVFSKVKYHGPMLLVLNVLPILTLIFPVIYLSYHKISGPILPLGIIFIVALSFMAWSAIKSLFGSYYSTGSAKLMAAAGLLILICDCSVILSQFGPACPHYLTLLLKTITWGTWIPAWTLVAVLIAEDNLVSAK